MKFLKDFLSTKPTQSQIYPILECSENEIKILKYMTKNFVDSNGTSSVYKILCDVFGNENYEFLNHLCEIKSLSELGFIVEGYGFFRPNGGEAVKIQRASTLGLLNSEVELSEGFLKILESGCIEVPNQEILPYSDHLEYLKDRFYQIGLYYKRVDASSDEFKKRLFDKIENIQNLIEKKLKITKIPIIIEQIFKDCALNNKEQIIFLALLKEEYGGEIETLRELNTLVALVSQNDIDRIKNRALLEEGSNLLTSGLVDYDEIFSAFGGVGRSFFINEEVLSDIMHPKNPKKTKKLRLENMIKDSEIFELIEPKTDISDVILNPKTKELLENIMRQLDRKVLARLNSWGIKSRRGVDAKIIFYGPAGTGKTMSALSLAKSLKKPVLSFDCSKILSKYIGESEQNVRKIFDVYKEICTKSKSEPVLLLNEADQFLSTRIEGGISGGEKMHNQMQNIFLEQIEKFSGVLVATTNFLESLDRAFSRRFDYKIEFKKPTYDERVAIWRKVIPQNADFEENFDIHSLAKFELSGAQIVLVLKNTALKVAIKEDGIFTFKDFESEIMREMSNAFGEDNKKVGLL